MVKKIRRHNKTQPLVVSESKNKDHNIRLAIIGILVGIAAIIIPCTQQYFKNKEESDEKKAEKINYKIKEYKKVLDISDKLSYLSLTWNTYKFKVNNMNIYPTSDDYEQLYTKGIGIMNLLANKDDLLLDSLVKEKWNFGYYMFDKYFKFKEFNDNLMKNIPKTENYHAYTDSINTYKGYYWTDSASIELQKSLKDYANKQIQLLNDELTKTNTKH